MPLTRIGPLLRGWPTHADAWVRRSSLRWLVVAALLESTVYAHRCWHKATALMIVALVESLLLFTCEALLSPLSSVLALFLFFPEAFQHALTSAPNDMFSNSDCVLFEGARTPESQLLLCRTDSGVGHVCHETGASEGIYRVNNDGVGP